MRLNSARKKGTATYKKTFDRANRFVWTRLLRHQITIGIPEHTKYGTPRVLLTFIGTNTSQAFTIDLTALTGPELAAFKETALIATEVAEPIVEGLDRAALENADADDSDDRLYRPLPTVVVRKGALREYAEGVLQRRDAVLRSLDATILAGVGAAADGGDVDRHEQEGLEAQDDASEDDESP